MSPRLEGGPAHGVMVQSEHRIIETPVQCTGGMVCRAVYERGIFVGVSHLWRTASGDYETRMESAADWEKRQVEGFEYARRVAYHDF